MSRRTKNSLASLSEVDIQKLVLKLPGTDEAEDADVPKNVNNNKANKTYGDKIEPEQPELIEPELHDHVDKDDSCSKCGFYREELNKLQTVVIKIQLKQDEDRRKSESVRAKTDAQIKFLIERNTTMAAEIESLKATVDETSNDNAVIRSALEIKQGEWTEVKHTKSANMDKKRTENNTNITSIHNQNRFTPLENQEVTSDEIQVDCGIKAQLTDYRAKQQAKFKNTKKKATNKKLNAENPSASEKHNTPIATSKKSKENIDLVIGDSMVKNIDNNKLSKAAKKGTVCHSYSGATVEQIATKFDQHSKEDQSFDKVIIHVGTNDLVRTQPDKVAQNMESLIVKVKSQAKQVAASAVVRRYDNKVKPIIISSYNNLLHNLCIKHKIAYIDNDCIDNSMLNRSNLHLNKNGDRALGSAFCAFLKPKQIPNYASNTTRNSGHFLWKSWEHQKRDRSMYYQKQANKVLMN